MALLCFDVDGTLEPGIGPIPMKELEELADEGHVIVIVSPSPLRPKETPYQEFLSTDRKKTCWMHEKRTPKVKRFISATMKATITSQRLWASAMCIQCTGNNSYLVSQRHNLHIFSFDFMNATKSRRGVI